MNTHMLPIALVNPPLANIIQPFVALAALQGQLRAHGFTNVRIWDTSQRIVRRQLTEDYLNETGAALDAYLAAALPAKQPATEVEAIQRDHALAGREAARRSAPAITNAVAVLRDPARFFNLTQYHSAMATVDDAFAAISARFFPQHLSRTTYAASLVEDLQDEHHVRTFVTDPDRCLWHGFFLADIIDEICNSQPRLIGISATFRDQFLPGVLLASLFKQRLPAAHIVIGGAFVSSCRNYIAARPWFFDWFDSMSVYEGETPIVELAKALKRGDPLDDVPNLYRRVDGEVRGPSSLSTERLEQLPAPDYAGYEPDDYLAPAWDVIYDPTRGCYWNRCTFCAVSLSTRRTASREREAVRIVDHMAMLCERHETDVITFGVDAIPVPLMRRVSEELIRRRLDIGWSSEFILDKKLTSDTIALFAEAGCLMLLFGLESANSRVLRLMKKGNLLDRSERIIRDCARSGIRVLLHLIVGFPSETAEEVERTVAFVEGLADAVDAYEINGFGLVDETPIWEMFEQLGITRVDPMLRPFQAWSDRAIEVREGVRPEWVEAALPSLRCRLDAALGLSGQRYLRWDDAHLHLYLKRLRRRPRDLQLGGLSKAELSAGTAHTL
jgi:radical SAM superfamily enzyme YgiQ (UPF0313 family)